MFESGQEEKEKELIFAEKEREYSITKEDEEELTKQKRMEEADERDRDLAEELEPQE